MDEKQLDLESKAETGRRMKEPTVTNADPADKALAGLPPINRIKKTIKISVGRVDGPSTRRKSFNYSLESIHDAPLSR